MTKAYPKKLAKNFSHFSHPKFINKKGFEIVKSKKKKSKHDFFSSKVLAQIEAMRPMFKDLIAQGYTLAIVRPKSGEPINAIAFDLIPPGESPGPEHYPVPVRRVH